MLELGPYEVRGHEMVGVRAAEVVDELVTVGELGRIIAVSAQKSGLSDSAITPLATAQEAIRHLEPHLEKEDVVLVKGSRGMRMDRIVAALEHRR
jgi:UDP-N-acetylmuramoyl-tripeptide--D-alanyl-D-alanine ligase